MRSSPACTRGTGAAAGSEIPFTCRFPPGAWCPGRRIMSAPSRTRVIHGLSRHYTDGRAGSVDHAAVHLQHSNTNGYPLAGLYGRQLRADPPAERPRGSSGHLEFRRPDHHSRIRTSAVSSCSAVISIATPSISRMAPTRTPSNGSACRTTFRHPSSITCIPRPGPARRVSNRISKGRCNSWWACSPRSMNGCITR